MWCYQCLYFQPGADTKPKSPSRHANFMIRVSDDQCCDEFDMIKDDGDDLCGRFTTDSSSFGSDTDCHSFGIDSSDPSTFGDETSSSENENDSDSEGDGDGKDINPTANPKPSLNLEGERPPKTKVKRKLCVSVSEDGSDGGMRVSATSKPNLNIVVEDMKNEYPYNVQPVNQESVSPSSSIYDKDINAANMYPTSIEHSYNAEKKCDTVSSFSSSDDDDDNIRLTFKQHSRKVLPLGKRKLSNVKREKFTSSSDGDVNSHDVHKTSIEHTTYNVHSSGYDKKQKNKSVRPKPNFHLNGTSAPIVPMKRKRGFVSSSEDDDAQESRVKSNKQRRKKLKRDRVDQGVKKRNVKQQNTPARLLKQTLIHLMQC